ncbi:hypothetical protein [Pigmentiphaga sp. CHJ604]|uniref:hypothetical protein n=1 Tax=Pigmentiphaga sp. CHJ604 TaxID=3081984 RepID=UPI0030D535B2
MADPIKDGGQAFPVPGLSQLPNGGFINPEAGMTLRDYFAGQALISIAAMAVTKQGAATLLQIQKETGKHPNEAVGELAYEIADAALRARENGNG